MDDLTERVQLARQDSAAMEALIFDYLPFIKSEVAKATQLPLEHEDRLSLGMLVFTQCVYQYQPGRGAFLSYASVCMRNRWIDEARKAGRGGATVYLQDENAGPAVEAQASLDIYSQKQEQRILADEIERLEEDMRLYGISYALLSKGGPRQKRSRQLCANLAYKVTQTPALLHQLTTHRKLAQAALAAQSGVSVKTIEKHRRYIVALVLILSGDYPGIRAFVPEVSK